ncbi:MAG TPA: hypothetical protein VIH61_01115 [Waddliaceae bacterium]
MGVRIFNEGIEKPYCNTCHNTGYLKDETNPDVKDKCQICLKMEKLLQANIAFDYWNITAETFDGSAEDIYAIGRLCNPEVINVLRENSTGLYIFGEQNGIGKTSLAILFLKYILLETQFSCLFAPFKDVVLLINHFVNIYSPVIENKINYIKNVDFLVLDDLGKEVDYNKGALGSVALDSIMRYRVSYKKPTIITSNAALEVTRGIYGDHNFSILNYLKSIEMHGTADYRKTRHAKAIQALEEVAYASPHIKEI